MNTRQRKKAYEQAIKEIVTAIKSYDPEKIILFGSAVKGEFREDSDIDLLVVKDTNEPYWERQIKVTLMYKGLIPTDIFVITPKELEKAVSENRFFVIEEILKKGKTIYEKYH